LLWLNREELFSPDSKYADDIIKDINRTRGSGSDREESISTILNKLPFLSLELRGAAGSVEDFSGTDAIITHNGIDHTAQIKPFKSYEDLGEEYLVNTKVIRKYKQDFLVFGKKQGDEYRILVFWNKDNEMKNGNILFPKKDLFLAVCFNRKENKLKYKLL
jgi:hypothetical protein